MTAVLFALLCFCGLAAGALLLREARFLSPHSKAATPTSLAIIIPARNEEKNLPNLLSSIRSSELQPAELLVVDDESNDATAKIAANFGASVLASLTKPEDWKGKPWACWQGANHAVSTLLLFLDADVRFCPHGLHSLSAAYSVAGEGTALSVLPYHRMEKPYEELSLFFNLLLAAGAGGFSGLSTGQLFGQSLLIDRELYLKVGGHSVVREHVLENLHMAPKITSVGGNTVTALGRGTVEMRMFPEGMQQLCSSWKKGFADGAKATSKTTMFLSILWLIGAMLPIVTTLAGFGVPRAESLTFYAVSALEVWLLARIVGSYRWTTAVLYFVPLVFYFILFTQSLLSRGSGKSAVWKGRQV